MSVDEPNPPSRRDNLGDPGSQDSQDSPGQPQPWQPRLIRLGEAEVELRWWGQTQLALAVLLALVAVGFVVMIVVERASGEMPWQPAIVVACMSLAAVISAGWFFHHREVGLRLDSTALTHHNRLGSFRVPWDQVLGVDLVNGRGGPILRIFTRQPVHRSGRRSHDVMVASSQVPAIAAAVRHWTGRPLRVSVAGTTVPWQQGDGPDA